MTSLLKAYSRLSYQKIKIYTFTYVFMKYLHVFGLSVLLIFLSFAFVSSYGSLGISDNGKYFQVNNRNCSFFKVNIVFCNNTVYTADNMSKGDLNSFLLEQNVSGLWVACSEDATVNNSAKNKRHCSPSGSTSSTSATPTSNIQVQTPLPSVQVQQCYSDSDCGSNKKCESGKCICKYCSDAQGRCYALGAYNLLSECKKCSCSGGTCSWVVASEREGSVCMNVVTNKQGVCKNGNCIIPTPTPTPSSSQTPTPTPPPLSLPTNIKLKNMKISPEPVSFGGISFLTADVATNIPSSTAVRCDSPSASSCSCTLNNNRVECRISNTKSGKYVLHFASGESTSSSEFSISPSGSLGGSQQSIADKLTLLAMALAAVLFLGTLVYGVFYFLSKRAHPEKRLFNRRIQIKKELKELEQKVLRGKIQEHEYAELKKKKEEELEKIERKIHHLVKSRLEHR